MRLLEVSDPAGQGPGVPAPLAPAACVSAVLAASSRTRAVHAPSPGHVFSHTVCSLPQATGRVRGGVAARGLGVHCPPSMAQGHLAEADPEARGPRGSQEARMEWVPTLARGAWKGELLCSTSLCSVLGVAASGPISGSLEEGGRAGRGRPWVHPVGLCCPCPLCPVSGQQQAAGPAACCGLHWLLVVGDCV